MNYEGNTTLVYRELKKILGKAAAQQDFQDYKISRISSAFTFRKSFDQLNPDADILKLTGYAAG